MSLVIFPRNFTVDVNGTPRAAAKAYFYEPTTTNPITIYTTNSFAVTQTNPVTASSPSGIFAAVHINPAVNPTYKIVIKDSVGTEIYTEDNIPTTAMSQAEIGGALYPRTAAEIAAGITPTSYIYPELYLDRYGAVGNGSTDDAAAFTSAIAVAVVSGGDIVLRNRNYLTSGGHQIFSACRVRFIGAGQGATTITHNGNNRCFWFKPTHLINGAGSGVYHCTVNGTNVGSSACFARFSDGWGLKMEDVTSYGYTGGTFCELYNYAGWTEGNEFIDVMVREALIGWAFNRSGGGTDTDSFGFLKMIRCQMVLEGGSNIGIYAAQQALLPKSIYQARIDFHIWYGSVGGGKRGIFIETGCLLSGVLHMDSDGIGDPTGVNLYMIRAFGGVIDCSGYVNSEQSHAVASTAKFKALLRQDSIFTADGLRPLVRVKGAILKLATTTVGANTTGTYASEEMPPYSTFRVKVTWSGFTTTGTAEWLVETMEGNVVAYCTKLAGSDSGGKVVVRGPGGASGGAFSAGNGLQFEIFVDTTATVACDWSADIEML